VAVVVDARTCVSAMLALLGCEQVTPLEQEDACVVPNEVQRVFDESCSDANCHGTQGAVGAGLSLAEGPSDELVERNSTQVGSLPLVAIGNVSGSYLAIKIQDGLPGAQARLGLPMPPIDALSESDRALVIAWIAGAQLQCGDAVDTDTSP
jgi:hypothetical protein